MINTEKKADNLALDNASCVVIPLSSRKKYCMEHEYEVEYKGRIVRCRTAEAMTRLLQVIAQEDRAKDDIPWNDHDFAEFTGRIRIFQRQLLKALLENIKVWMTDEELRSAMRVRDNRALAGLLSGISKVALALDIEPARVYVAQMKYEKSKPVRFYRIGSAFKKIAEAHGWPAKEDLVADEEDDY